MKRCSSWILLPFASLCRTWAVTILSSWMLDRKSIHVYLKVSWKAQDSAVRTYLQIVPINDSSFTGVVDSGLRGVLIFISRRFVFEQPAVLRDTDFYYGILPHVRESSNISKLNVQMSLLKVRASAHGGQRTQQKLLLISWNSLNVFSAIQAFKGSSHPITSEHSGSLGPASVCLLQLKFTFSHDFILNFVLLTLEEVQNKNKT